MTFVPPLWHVGGLTERTGIAKLRIAVTAVQEVMSSTVMILPLLRRAIT